MAAPRLSVPRLCVALLTVTVCLGFPLRSGPRLRGARRGPSSRIACAEVSPTPPDSGESGESGANGPSGDSAQGGGELDADDLPSEGNADADMEQRLKEELKRRELDGNVSGAEGTAGLDEFNSDLYDHLKRRPEFADRVLYNQLATRIDVAENVFNSWRDLVDGSTKLEPQAGQTPGEVIQLVLRALQDCDYPHEGHGIDVLQRFSSEACVASPGKINAEMLYRYVQDSKFRVLLEWVNIMYSKKLDTSLEGKRAYQELRLKSGSTGQWMVLNFMLSLCPQKNVWLIDHIRVRGASGVAPTRTLVDD